MRVYTICFWWTYRRFVVMLTLTLHTGLRNWFRFCQLYAWSQCDRRFSWDCDNKQMHDKNNDFNNLKAIRFTIEKVMRDAQNMRVAYQHVHRLCTRFSGAGSYYICFWNISDIGMSIALNPFKRFSKRRNEISYYDFNAKTNLKTIYNKMSASKCQT